MHQPATRRLAAWASAAVLALCVTSCSGDDADPLSTLTDPPTTTTPPAMSTTTAAVTTTQPPTTTSPPDTTTTPPATTSVDDLKAQIAAEGVAGYERMSAMLASPSLDGLDDRLATVALPASDFDRLLRDRIAYLVSVGDVTIPDEPPINMMTVESVALDEADPSSATLTVCQVDNLKTVTPAQNSPVGEEIVSQEPQLAASRYTIHATRSGSVWLRDDYSTVYLGYYPGATECAAP
jgi:hypothetical protein